MSFVEVLITAAVVSLIFGGLMAAFQLSLSLVGRAKAEAGALSLAGERMEYLRSLAYEDVGTIEGIPDGPVPQSRSVDLNGVMYTERVLVQYVDAPEDGTGAEDENGILADYKQAKVEYSWDRKGVTESLSLISNIVPKGIETTAGGGTLVVNVFDAAAIPVEGALVSLYNDTGTTTVDTTRYTNVDGIATFAGAPARAGYEITVTKPNFSTDGTYAATAENPNPSTPHVAVIASEVSTMNFQIDVLADLLVRTIGEPVADSFIDTFDTANSLEYLSNATVSAGALKLSLGESGYAPSGEARSASTTPSVITTWQELTFEMSAPTSTAVTVQLYSVSGGGYTLVPDAALPGNSVGLTTPVDISGLDPATYPSLAPGATLQTSDASSTPELLEWELAYNIEEPPISGVPFTLTGSKVIGTDVDDAPIYKYEETHTSDASGLTSLLDLEWDLYDLTLDTGTYDIKEACAPLPLTLAPGASETLTLTLVNSAPHTLLVTVKNTAGEPIADADVSLTRPAWSSDQQTTLCGQTFFNSGVISANDYQLDVSATGYVGESIPAITVDGDTSAVAELSPL